MDKQKHHTQAKQKRYDFIFGWRNYKFMLIGLAVIAIGFTLMAGGGSDDPNVFNPDIFNVRRIRIAPTIVLLGFAIEAYAILISPNKK
ncbi:MAG: DUF3098 domain-containing protein [Psychroflexus sp.]|jgi:hypothetical protein|nr:DUF3098 domain-containing protein [Psychroflexus sp.]MDR9448092.1 DUF3098 domain-containing protein [Psychroflexus sp.]